MNDTRRIRLLTGIIVFLVALNVGLLSWFFLRTDTHPHRSGRQHSQTFLADTLGFDDHQRQQLLELQQAYLRHVRPRQRQLRQARKAYFRLADSSFTVAQRRERAMAFHQRSATVELMTLAHFDKVAVICTSAQRQVLNELLSKLPDRTSGGRMFRTPGKGDGRHRSDRSAAAEKQPEH